VSQDGRVAYLVVVWHQINNSAEEAITENHQTDDEQLPEATEKKPRRRRTVKPKVEKAAEEEA